MASDSDKRAAEQRKAAEQPKVATPPVYIKETAPSDTELLTRPQPGGGAETLPQVVEKAKEQADVKAETANAAAEAASELQKIAGIPMAPLNRATEDVLGHKLPADPNEARAQERQAIGVRQMRVDVDVARTQRGLAPKFATK